MAISFKDRLSTIFRIIWEPKVLKFLLSLRDAGYLYEKGWFQSFKTGSSFDKNNEPIPWMTYSFIDFIKVRLNKEISMFEFGSGNSTIFFAGRVKKIIAVEHNQKWYEQIKNKLPLNAEIRLASLDEKYENSVNVGQQFDIIIVDGERRVECIVNSVKALSKTGIIILDDSEREDYKIGVKYLLGAGFKTIEFWGVAPGTFFNKCTTIFYKRENGLNI